ncbi:MAG: ATP synthase F0 subunit C [Thermosulfidibacteraceae bacterium]|jgi:F-type H+-transporting ATPase subunit c
MRNVLRVILFAAVSSLFAMPAFAEDLKVAALDAMRWAVLAAAFGLGFAAGLCGVGQGISVRGAMEGIARNPEASGKITVAMIIGLAMIEALTIYCLVVALIILFADPLKAVKIIGG